MIDLEQAFSDSKVIDIDLSQWDFMIDIWILADHWREWSGRMLLLKVCFRRIKSFSIDFNNLGVELEAGKHCQWNTCGLEHHEEDGFLNIRILGDTPSLLRTEL